MANIYDQASLVMIPSGTKASKIFSQKPVNGDGDFTFSRSTAATRVNADGNIEKETQNLLLQSNSFNNWISNNTSETSGQSGYDGTNDAWLLAKSAASAYMYVNNTVSGVQTFSIYAKSGSISWMRIVILGAVDFAEVFFNLADGSVGLTSGLISSNSENIGGGWYRYSIAINGSPSQVRIYPADADNNTFGSSGNIYIQDAQRERGLVARDYIETTTAAVEGGITDNVPRLDYTDSSCPALLLEPLRTNSQSQSEYLSDTSAWGLGSISISSNATTSPDGYTNAAKVVESATTARHELYGKVLNYSGTSSISFFAKAAERRYLSAFVGGNPALGGATFDVQDGVVTDTTGGTTSSIVDYGNGWYRCSFTSTNSTSTPLYVALRNSGVGVVIETYAGDGTSGLYFWGGQTEINSPYATSYIPTYGTSVTRNADASLVTGVSDIIGQSEGTAYVDFMFNNKGDAGVDSSFFAMKNSAGTSYLNIFRLNTTLAFRFFDNGSNQFFHTETPANQTRLKIAFAYKQNDFALYINGVQEAVDTNGSVGAMSQIHLAGFSVGDNITENYQTMLFKTRLSNEELAALTTI